ncbi:MAG: hypothetical protein A2X51_09555 [Candidatus Rokubacteria bacterium GWC2_70_24]|nr:MAG: hypothetical protein A2X51_09555 [Candidatus Rokubacteria bacterium GWC2_70_24]
MKRRAKFIVGGVVILGALGYLIYAGVSQSVIYFVTPSELMAAPVSGKTYRLGGMVQAGTLKWEPKSLDLTFAVSDGKTAVPVLVYTGYLLLRGMVDEPERRGRYAAVVGIVGAANIPIVHFSVKWWRALHQPSTILGPEPSPIAAPIATALLVNWVAFTLLFVYFLARRIEIARLDDGAVDA